MNQIERAGPAGDGLYPDSVPALAPLAPAAALIAARPRCRRNTRSTAVDRPRGACRQGQRRRRAARAAGEVKLDRESSRG